MNPLTIALTAFGAILVGAFVGTQLRTRLPAHHLKPESLEVIRLAAGLISTMAALVLSLLITSAKGSFDRVNNALLDDGARLLTLDRMLADYGPEAKVTREEIKRAYAGRVERLTGKASQIVALTSEQSLRDLDDALAQIDRLTPRTETQRALQLQAAKIAGEIAATRSLLILHQSGSIPMVLVVVLIAWLVLIFAAFGIVGTNSAASRVTLVACALAAASAVFMIVELDRPFSGFIAVHAAPLYDVLMRLGR
jgi:ABC-type multidrug transport system fused ATPase/permease subunit